HGDVLITELLAPMMNWGIEHHFQEIESRNFKNAGFEGIWIDPAFQSFRFRLDETGAYVKSEALFGGRAIARPLVCDRPYLIALRRRGAEQPYFLMWVDNAELLCK